jgi:hypothetical protein
VKAPRVKLRRGRLVGTPLRAGGEADDTAAARGPKVVNRGGRLVLAVRPASGAPSTSSEADTLAQLAAEQVERASWMSKILLPAFILSLLIPMDMRVASLRLTPYLLIIAAMFLPWLFMWLGGKRTRRAAFDFTLLAFCGWAAVALILSVGLGNSIQTLGVHVLQTFGGYLAGRMLVTGPTSMRYMVRVTVLAILAMTPFTLLEAVTGQKLILKAAGLLGNALAPVDAGVRLGLHRAQGAFEHPILMGIFCASAMSIGFYSFRDRRFKLLRWIAAPLTSFNAVLSLSTGALLSLNLQFGLMLWSRVLRTVRQRWAILAALVAVAYIAVDMVSTKTPFHVFVNYATFSSTSSYNRILIWEFGSAEAMRHPWFGIGLGDWTRPRYMSSSMDNFWLVQAVRYGMPALFLLVTTIVLILWRAGQRPFASEELRLMRRGIVFSLIATMVAISSVHLWNASYVWFMFLIGSAAWIAAPAAEKAGR